MPFDELPSLDDLPGDGLLLPSEVAAYLRCDERTLESWRLSRPRRGPAFIRLGNGSRSPLRYRVDVVREWVARRTAESGETPAAA